MPTTDVIIVGAGPAGCSTALHLAALDPAWADRVVLIDKAKFPRDKLCGGGITYFGYQFLERLGIDPGPCFGARFIRLRHEGREFAFEGEPTVRVIRREVFDHLLLQAAEAAGFEVRQEVAFQGLEIAPDSIALSTDHGPMQAEIVVGADGSASRVDHALGWNRNATYARTLEVLTPTDKSSDPEFVDQAMTVDFTALSRNGLRGYVWHFPAFVDGRAHVSRGVYECRLWPRRPKADLEAILVEALRQRGLDPYRDRRHSFPIRQWSPDARCAGPRALLIGDAVGADPLTGEGLAFALAHGAAAAEAIHDAFARNDFSFSDHPKRVDSWPVLHQLSTRTAVARWVYRLSQRHLLNAVWWATRHLVNDLDRASWLWGGLDVIRRRTGQR